MKIKKIFTKLDYLLIIILALAAIISFTVLKGNKNSDYLTAVVTYKGEKVHEINLSNVQNPYDIEINGDYPLKIHIEKGEISVINASCHDKLCEKCGILTEIGDSAICLPNKTSIVLRGGSDKGTDAVTW